MQERIVSQRSRFINIIIIIISILIKLKIHNNQYIYIHLHKTFHKIVLDLVIKNSLPKRVPNIISYFLIFSERSHIYFKQYWCIDYPYQSWGHSFSPQTRSPRHKYRLQTRSPGYNFRPPTLTEHPFSSVQKYT